MLQGGIDEGETPAEAASRELQEETGISKASIIAQVGLLPPGSKQLWRVVHF